MSINEVVPLFPNASIQSQRSKGSAIFTDRQEFQRCFRLIVESANSTFCFDGAPKEQHLPRLARVIIHFLGSRLSRMGSVRVYYGRICYWIREEFIVSPQHPVAPRDISAAAEELARELIDHWDQAGPKLLEACLQRLYQSDPVLKPCFENKFLDAEVFLKEDVELGEHASYSGLMDLCRLVQLLFYYHRVASPIDIEEMIEELGLEGAEAADGPLPNNVIIFAAKRGSCPGRGGLRLVTEDQD